jgi:hypothetical protein
MDGNGQLPPPGGGGRDGDDPPAREIVRDLPPFLERIVEVWREAPFIEREIPPNRN